MQSAIVRLESALWDSCVTRMAPANTETAQRWQSDGLAYLKEGFLINPMPESLQPLVDEALAQWKQIEKTAWSRLQMTNEQFFPIFEKMRDSYLQEDDEWKSLIVSVGPALYGAVMNMDWVNLFAWILPMSNPDNFNKYYFFGRLVTAFFYTECLWKFYESDSSDSDRKTALMKIETRWFIINQPRKRSF